MSRLEHEHEPQRGLPSLLPLVHRKFAKVVLRVFYLDVIRDDGPDIDGADDEVETDERAQHMCMRNN